MQATKPLWSREERGCLPPSTPASQHPKHCTVLLPTLVICLHSPHPSPCPSVEEYAEGLAFKVYLNEGRLITQGEVELAEVEECEWGRRALACRERGNAWLGWSGLGATATPTTAVLGMHTQWDWPLQLAQFPCLPRPADLGGVLDFTGELGRLAIAQVGRNRAAPGGLRCGG